jgi:type IV pilus assembly protein PilA
VITITTTAAAGGGSLLLVPFTKSGTTDSALPAPTATSVTIEGVVQWKCMAKDSAAFVGVSVPTDALDKKYVPSDCK